MTTRRTITIDVEDIPALEVRCGNCSGLVSFPVGHQAPEFLKCPGCGQWLFEVGSPSSLTLLQLSAALVKWKSIAQKKFALTVTLDLPS